MHIEPDDTNTKEPAPLMDDDTRGGKRMRRVRKKQGMKARPVRKQHSAAASGAAQQPGEEDSSHPAA